jgi:hypothetical protein
MMSVILGGITLPDVVLDQEFGRQEVEAIVEYALDGTPIVWTQSSIGSPLVLTGGEDWGWITRSVLLQLQALARIPGATYTLDYEGTEYTVRFRHENAPVLEASPLLPRPNQDVTDFYNNVKIYLMGVDQ